MFGQPAKKLSIKAAIVEMMRLSGGKADRAATMVAQMAQISEAKAQKALSNYVKVGVLKLASIDSDKSKQQYRWNS